jgi:glycosyltransferase involved in cell wall biosynthesis
MCSSFLPHIGGKEIVVHNIMRLLRDYDALDARLLRCGNFRYRIKNNFPYPYHVYPKLCRNKDLNYFLILLIEKIVFGIDVIHLHGIMDMGMVLNRYQKRIGYKTILTPHGDDILKCGEIGYGERIDRKRELEIRDILKGSACNTAISAIVKKNIDELAETESVMIPNGINLQYIRRHASGMKAARERLGLKESDKIVIAVGRNNKVKGFDILLAGMAALKESVPDLKLVLVGKDNEKMLSDLVSGYGLYANVIFPGQIPKNEHIDPMNFETPDRLLLDYYSAANAFVSTSFSESFGLTTLEAMAVGKPVVATRIFNNSDASSALEDGKNGFVIEPGRPHQVAEKLSILLNNEKLQQEMGKNALKKAREFDWVNVLCQYAGLYQRIAQN